jgi:CheY-like chemotaxis protein
MTGKRVLVVEDQEDLRGVLRDLLTGSGYAVLEALDGQAGIATAKSDRQVGESRPPSPA